MFYHETNTLNERRMAPRGRTKSLEEIGQVNRELCRHGVWQRPEPSTMVENFNSAITSHKIIEFGIIRIVLTLRVQW